MMHFLFLFKTLIFPSIKLKARNGAEFQKKVRIWKLPFIQVAL